MSLLDRKIILDVVAEKSMNRLGGCVPIYFLDKLDLIDGLNFYACFKHPIHNELLISIFIPSEYRILSENKIYPNCSVKVFVHQSCDESEYNKHICEDLKRIYLSDYVNDDIQEGIIQIGGVPQLIQDEEYYIQDLQKDNYIFFMQIDEAFYPDELVIGSYPFNFGALYLYYHKDDTKNIIAGFWQNS